MNGELADYMKLKACWWLHVQDTIQVKMNKTKTKKNKKMAPNSSFDNKYMWHYCILYCCQPTAWIQANADDILTLLYTLWIFWESGYWPVNVAATAGQTAAPWWKRNEKLHRATLNPTPVALRPLQPSRTSCTRFAPPWRRRWSADRRTSPPWTPGCPLIQKKGWCCWKENRRARWKGESGSTT